MYVVWACRGRKHGGSGAEMSRMTYKAGKSPYGDLEFAKAWERTGVEATRTATDRALIAFRGDLSGNPPPEAYRHAPGNRSRGRRISRGGSSAQANIAGLV